MSEDKSNDLDDHNQDTAQDATQNTAKKIRHHPRQQQ